MPDGRTGFWVLLADGQRISARRLLVTTGLRDELPDIPGLRDRWARDVLHCPYCHGHEVRDRRLGVIGGTPGAVRYAQIVRQWTHDLVYFTPPGVLTAAERTELLARAIGVVEGTIDQLVIDEADQLRGVQMDDGCVIPRDALFVPPRFVPNNDLLIGLGCDRRRRRLGRPSTPPGAPAFPGSGPPATSSTRAPRSSPPPAPAPRPPSPSTPTWSTTTCATPSATSTTDFRPHHTRHHPPEGDSMTTPPAPDPEPTGHAAVRTADQAPARR